ncbi:helix-turn-helix transcriptional regulator [Cellulomonas sp. 179-A 9B4 NHS]|uniref:helix-turn-helix transcriptional regulator n=1 Tax=Cellulomonas sp. 179-A 9B4 NHS TaxID=3142379 RepID=UPI00399FF16C
MDDVPDSPLVRSLRALDVLQHAPGVTAADLASRLGVTERAVRRYVAALRAAGVPVVSERGRHGGYRVGRGLRLPPVVFTETEALALVMAVLDGSHAAADPATPVGSALGTVIRALPEQVGRAAATVRSHAALAADPDRVATDPATAGALVTAAARHRRVALRYRQPGGASWDAEVDPWAVVVRHRRWYLLCHSHRAGATRALRVDRVEAVTVLDAPASVPAGLDPVAVLERHLGAGWPHATHVTFHAPYAAVAPWVPASTGHLTPRDDGARCELRGSTNDPDAYAAERLAPVPFPLTVHGGPELVAAAGRLARRFAAAVDAPPDARAGDDEGPHRAVLGEGLRASGDGGI